MTPTLRHGLQIFTILAISGISVSSFASNSGVTYQGRILKPDGSPLAGQNVQFKMQIRSPDGGDCLMYEEAKAAIDMRASNGAFSLTMNDGTGARTSLLISDGANAPAPLTIDRIFSNRGSLTFDGVSCNSGNTYAPNQADGRNLVVLFKDETMASWEPIPAQKINFVPFAIEAKQVQGFTADSLVRVVNGNGDPLTGLSPLSNAQYTELLALLNGTTTQYSKSGQLGGVAIPSTSSLTSGQVLSWNGTTWAATSVVGGAGSVTSTMLAASAVTSTAIAAGAVGSSQIAGTVSINTSGSLGARDIKIYPAGSGTGFVEMQANASIADGSSYLLKWPATAGSVNQVLTTDGFGVLSWAAPTVSSQWTTHGSNVSYDGGGRVGIGTTSPSVALTVIGDMRASSSVQASTGSGDDATLWPGSVLNTSWGGNLNLYTFSPLGVSRAGQLYLSGSSGNVGIGTTAPTAALQVEGGTLVHGVMKSYVEGDGNYTYSDTYRDNTLGGGYYLRHARGTLASPTISASGDTNTIYFANFDGTQFKDDASIQSIVESATGSIPTALSFSTRGTTGGVLERLHIMANGNVGVGLAAPTALIQIKAGAAAAGSAPLKFSQGPVLSTAEDGAIEYDGTNYFATIGSTRSAIALSGLSSNFNVVGAGAGSSAAPSLSFSGDTDSGFYSSTANTIGIATNGTKIFDLSGSGLVSPFIGGANVTAAAGTASAPTYSFGGDTSTGWFRPAASNLAASTGGTERMRIDANGNVGIGTTSPTNTLDIQAPAATLGLTSTTLTNRAMVFASNGSATARMGVANSTGGGVAGIAMPYAAVLGSDLTPLQLMTGGNARITIDNAGNVGVGTTSPGYPLTVIGSAAVSGTVKAGNGTAAAPAISFINNDLSGLYLPSLNNIGLSTNGSERLRIDANGNVGIGTTAPQSALQVIGSASFGQSSASTSNSLAAGNYSGTFAQNSVALGDHAATYGNNAFAFSTLQSTASGTASMVFGSNVRTGSGYASSGGDFSMAFGLGAAAGITPMVTGTGSMGIFMGDQSGANISANNVMVVLGGNVGIGATTPTASLHLKGGTAAASTAPLKFTAGTLLTTPEDGAMESTSAGLYYTIGSVRYVIPTNTAAGNYSNVSTISNSAGGITMSPMGSNAVIINSTATSTSATTGGLIITGGAGVTGAINASGNIVSGGSLTATNSVYAPQIYGGTSASQSIKIDGADNATKGSVLLAADGGRVGVGTTAPAYLLDIGASGTYGQLMNLGNATAAQSVYFAVNSRSWFGYNGATSNAVVQAGTSKGIEFNVNTNTVGSGQAMLITSGGNVGIGTTAPVGTLDVEGGTAAASTAGTSINVVAQNAGAGATNFGGNINLTAGDSVAVSSNRRNGGGVTLTGGRAAWVSGPLPAGGSVTMIGGPGNVSGNGGTASLQGGSAGSTIGSGGAAYVNGGWGSVTAGTGGAAYISGGGANEGIGGSVYLTAGAAATTGSSSFSGGGMTLTAGAGVGSGNGGGIWLSSGAGGASGNPGSVVLQPTVGNVGIGTTAPQSPLHVAAATTSELRLTNNTSGHSFFHGGLLQFSGLDLTLTNYETGGRIGFGVNGTQMTLTNAGNFGIGQTSPGSLLSVGSTTTRGVMTITGSTSATPIIQLDNSPAGGKVFSLYNGSAATGAFSIYDQNASVHRFVVDTNGNIGVGLTNPTYQLQLSTDSAAKPGTSTWTIASDVRLKDIRAPFTRGLEDLMGLHTIYFRYKKENPLGLPSDKEFVGIRAQDAQKVIPEAVSTDEKGFLHVTNDSIIWTAVNAIKELYGKSNDQATALSVQAREIASVKAENEKLKSDNQKLKSDDASMKRYLCSKDPAAPFCP